MKNLFRILLLLALVVESQTSFADHGRKQPLTFETAHSELGFGDAGNIDATIARDVVANPQLYTQNRESKTQASYGRRYSDTKLGIISFQYGGRQPWNYKTGKTKTNTQIQAVNAKNNEPFPRCGKAYAYRVQ